MLWNKRSSHDPEPRCVCVSSLPPPTNTHNTTQSSSGARGQQARSEREGYIFGAVTRMGVRFRGVNVTDVYARGVNVNLTPLTSNRGALATDTRGCSLWRYLLERLPPTWESRVRDPLGTRYELGRCGPGRGCYICIPKIIL